MLSPWAGLSHHPALSGGRALAPIPSGLVRLMGENPHPLVSARFPLHIVLFTELRSGLPYSAVRKT